MNKINIPWKDAPEWAKWAAMDADGSWYWYDKQPHCDNANFGFEWVLHKHGIRCEPINTMYPEWSTSLTPRPSDE